MKININDRQWYCNRENEERTRKRLQELIDMGCEELGIASFGVPNIVSGLYIEKVWRFTDEEWKDYIDWMKSVIKEKSNNDFTTERNIN